MKLMNNSMVAGDAIRLIGAANTQPEESHLVNTPLKAVLISLFFMTAAPAGAANVPSGLTGLWRFQDATNLGAATIGSDIVFSNAVYGTQFLGPWTDLGVESWHTKFSDGEVFQEQTYNYLAVNPNFAPNGGGSYVNNYTVMIDYVQTQAGPYNSLFQTARDGNANDGDLWIAGTNSAAATLYTTELGNSALTFDSSKWHRIVWSVDNSNFFRVYVDGTLYLDGPGQGTDGRYAVYPDRFNLFADNDGEDLWGLVGTVATWNRALSSEEVAGLGGWIDTNATPTPLILSETPEVTSVSPANGETNTSPDFSYQADILDIMGVVDTNSIQLLLDGVSLRPGITILPGAIGIKFASGGLLRIGSTHTYTLVAGASGVFYTNETTFTVQNYTAYEWRFTAGDLSAALGNGTMDYADSTTPGITSFGTTDGSTVPHIDGSPATYMHVPAFTDDLNGYYLYFDDSGPNFGTSAFINRYTLLFDMLVPSPWALDYLVPFFNTDPYNLDDADFYLYGDGEIGIGGGGYSDPGAVTSNVWFRLAFVADLANDTLTYYVNGTNVWSRPADGLGGRWALYSNQDPGPDLLLFNEGDPSGVYTHELYLSSVAFADRALGADEIAALGGPSADGILVPSFTPKPALTARQSENGVVISWPGNYVGYALESKTDLAGNAWQPVPGVTNNSVTISAGSGSQFFRLVQ